MATPKPTPEEKLFAVIQGAQQPPVRSRGRPLSLAGLGGVVASVVGPVDLPRINQALTVVLIGLGLLCVATPIVTQPKMSRVLAQADQRVAPFTLPAPLDGLKPTDSYVQLMHEKDPFRVGAHPAPAPAAEAPAPPEPPKPSPQELIKGLRLVGISWGPEPVAMIEESGTSQTFVLKTGGVVGQATVKEIQRDRVVLQVGGQDVELF